MKKTELSFNTKTVDTDNFTLTGVFSTGDIDRHNEVVDQKSWIIDDYMSNPVVLWSHDHYEPAIARTEALFINGDGNLEGTMKFAVKENPKAKIIFDLFAGEFLRAFSVGFMSEEQERGEDGVIVLKQNRLHEISAVNIGANQFALAKAKGIDVDVLEKDNRGAFSVEEKKAVENAYNVLGDIVNNKHIDIDTVDKKQVEKLDKEIKKETRSDISTKRSRVSRAGDRKRKAMTVLNKTLRTLYKEQRKK